MADLGAPSWSEIDASNDAVPPNGWPEGMAPSDVNNSARSQMGGEKRWWDRSNATQTTTGSSTAYVLTYAATEAALYDGEETSFVVHITSGSTPTLNRDGLGAKFLRKFDFATNAFISVGTGDLRTNQVARVRYNLSADRYDIIATSISPGAFVQTTSNNVFTGTNTFDNTVTMSTAAFNEAVRVDVASAATTDLGAILSNYARITGIVTITSLGTIASGTRRKVVFAGILIITHNATSLILPTGANITTAAGDCAEFESEGAGNWRCTSYERASGLALATSLSSFTNSLAANVPLNNVATYIDGPIVTVPAGTWEVFGTVTVYDPTTANAQIAVRLWNGGAIIAASAVSATNVAGGGVAAAISVSGIFTLPAGGSPRISCKDISSVNGLILFNQTGDSKDSTITAVRIA